MKDVIGLAIDLATCPKDGKMEAIVVRAPGIVVLSATISMRLALRFGNLNAPDGESLPFP